MQKQFSNFEKIYSDLADQIVKKKKDSYVAYFVWTNLRYKFSMLKYDLYLKQNKFIYFLKTNFKISNIKINLFHFILMKKLFIIDYYH